MKISPEARNYFNELKDGKKHFITYEDLSDTLNNGEYVFMLDIRDKPDYDDNHFKGSLYCDCSEIGDLIEEDFFLKEEKIIIICYSGQLSNQIVGLLRAFDFNAYSLKNGMDFDTDTSLTESSPDS